MTDTSSKAPDISSKLPSALAAKPRLLAKAFDTTVRLVTRNVFTSIGVFLLLLVATSSLLLPIVLPMSAANQSADILQPPSTSYWFGTDHLGRDILVRSLVGARVSVVVALASAATGIIVALPLGIVAGYFVRTWIDDVLMRATDVLLTLPLFMFAFAFLGITGGRIFRIGAIELTALWQVSLLLGIATVPKFARVARGATIAEREEDYVSTLRVIGVSRPAIMFKEILPNVLPPTMVQAFLWMAIAISAEAALSFLGLGIQPPQPTLGNMIRDAQSVLLLGAWWYSLFPGLILLALTVGLNLVGDGLSDLLDPQHRL